MTNSVRGDSSASFSFWNNKPVNDNVTQPGSTSRPPEETSLIEARPSKSPGILQSTSRRLALLAQRVDQQKWVDQPKETVRIGTSNVVPVLGADHMVSQQMKDETDDSSQWRKGLNYQSIHSVSEGTLIMVNELRLKHRQSNLYADVFGAGGNKEAKELVDGAHAKLRSLPGSKNIQLKLDQRHRQLAAMLPHQAGAIHDTLDIISTLGNTVKYAIPKAVSFFMLMETAGIFSIRVGTIPQPMPRDPGQPLRYGFTLNTSTVQNLRWTLGASFLISKGLKKLHDWWQPKYFTGLDGKRENIALLATAFRANSSDVRNDLADGAVAAPLIQAYGKGRYKLLKDAMAAVDRHAGVYMQALQDSTPMPMPADKHLAKTGVTRAALQLLLARLDEARLIETFTGQAEGEQARLGYWQPGLAFPGATVLPRAKNPRSEDAQSSSQARQDGHAEADFDHYARWEYSCSLWDYTPSRSETLEHLERKAREVSGSMTNWKQIRSDLSAAKKGDHDAMFRLAELCEKGHLGIPEGVDARSIARQLYAPAAKKGNAEAQYRLWGLLADECFTGRAVLRRERAALGWLLRAAKQGHVEAQYRLGHLHADEHFTGREEVRSDRAAVRWLALAAEQGHAQAQAELGMMHAAGRTGLDGYEAAILAAVWCESAVKAGARSPEVLFTLARLYRERRVEGGQTDEEHDAVVAKWYVEAAEEGHVVAQRELGLLHLEGAPGLTGWRYDGAWEKTAKTGANDIDAARYLRMAAEQNDPEALYQLGKMYFENRASAKGSTAEEAAANCFKRAADGGLAQAQCELARMYVEGLARPKDGKSPDAAAVTLYEQAMVKDSSVAQEALDALADLLQAGRVGNKKGSEANRQVAEWLTLAAGHEKAHPRIAYRLAELYARSTLGLQTGPEGDALAAEWYAQAAAKGFKDAKYKLAHMHLKGRAGLPEGPEADGKAVELLTQVAKAGNAAVQFELAGLYAKGRGTVPSGFTHDQMAARWYAEATKKEHPQACYELGQLYEQRQHASQGGERALAEAVKLYRVAAEKGVAPAQYRLGELYRTGRATPEEGAGEQAAQEAAVDCFKRAADSGLAEAQFAVGWMLALEKTVGGGEPDHKEAARRFAQAAGQGHGRAQYELAKMYVKGSASPEDGKSSHEAAEALYEQAAAKGFNDARYRLAHLYLKTDRKAAAVGLLTKAAEAGHTDAQFELAGMYIQRQATPPGNLTFDDAALLLYKKAAAKVHPQACYELGNLYEKRYSERKEEADLAEAVKLYRVAAEKGVASAQYRLGEFYRTGRATLEGAGVQGILKEAKRLFEQASKQDHMHARFQYGQMLLEDATESADTDKQQAAVEIMTEAATAAGDPVLEHQMSVLYRNSKTSTKAWRRQFDEAAVEWLTKAANQGYVESIRELGWMYEAGRGGLDSKDASLDKAIEYYEQAAAKGDGYALFRLGALTETGYAGVKEGEKHGPKVIELYKQAAVKGNVYAMHALGRRHAQGRCGLPQDTSPNGEAARWLEAAAKKGSKEAQADLDSLMAGKGLAS